MNNQRRISRKMARKALRLGAALFAACLLSPAKAQEGAKIGTWAFEHPKDSFKADALLDLRSLNEKEAGETGFVKLSPDGNSFALGNGKPIRFWAVVTDVYRKTPEEVAEHARFLAKLGVNMVRLHTQLAPTGATSQVTDVNEKEIDGIWRAVAAFKKEGIYATISPYWANGKDANQWGIEGYAGQTDLWGLLFFNETLQKGYKSWVKALYTRKNPYTGIPLAQDPAVAIIQVQNEDGMFFWTMQGMKPEQQEKLGIKFGKWLAKKYGSMDKTKLAWENAGNEKDDFANGKVGILPTWMLTQPQAGGMGKRAADQTEFFAETQRTFYADIADYYHKDLGCKQLINSSNWITADPIRLNDLERWTNTADDVLAVNKYTGGVHVGDNNGWRIDPGHHFTNNSCLLDPRSLPTNLKQAAHHPMMITESTWVHPEGFQSEGPLLMAAYQSLSGIDTFYWFAAGGVPQYETDPYFNFLNFAGGQHALYKWTCATPELMGEFPACALMYRLGYIQQGATAVHEERTLDDMWQRHNPLIAEDRTFDPNRDTGSARGQSDLKGADPLAFLVGPVEVQYGGDPAKNKVADLTQYIDHDKKTVKSDTGQVKLNYGDGLFTLNTPKAQAVSGFLSKAGTFPLSDVTIKSNNPYATIAVVAMDDQPLATSHKILVQVGTYARPTGWESKPVEFKGEDGKQTFQGYEIVNTGKMPWQIANTDASISLANPNIKKAILLDTSGYPLKTLTDGKIIGGRFTLTLPPNTMYLILE